NEQLFDNDARSLLSGGSKLFNSEKEFFFCNKNLVYEVSGKQLLMRQVLPSTSIVSICKIGDFFYSSDGKTISANSGEIQFTIDESKGLTIKDIQFLINWDEDLLIVGKEQIQLFKLPVEFNSMIPNVKLSSVEGSFKSTKTSFESDFLGNELIMQFQVWPNLKSRGKDVLFYKIEGIHTDWQSSTSENDYRIVEDRLPYGTYKVVFYVANEDGVTSDVQEFEIIIHSPYYMKWWFFMSLGLLVLGIFFLIYRWRISVLNKRNLKKIEEEKLKIKALQSELKALRSQMNPHFIFNTLGVIQSKILNEDSKGAYQNLSTFSKLLRQALMFTTKEFITIREEIEFIQNYVQLIQARNPNSFSYTVKISETVDLNIMFPSLISQPYVENAIRHGLMHKLEGSKSLIVKIQGNNDDLKFVIEDNGIGRDASTKLNKEIRENHESFATKAMDSRIEIINLSQPFKWSVEIIDLEEGTRVIIHQVRKNEQPKTASDIS
ncbi:MAG: histidine kinase, partial [Flavobacteriales bacterium]|nr:histidine kinase [Flavobacteriales bacterium]